jgi:glutamine synthetase adenylyltransferase
MAGFLSENQKTNIKSIIKSTILLLARSQYLKLAKEQPSLLRQLIMLFIASNHQILKQLKFRKLFKLELNMLK